MKMDKPLAEISEILENRKDLKTLSDPGIYFLLDGSHIVYVGQSVQPEARIISHIRTEKDFDGYAISRCGHLDLDDLEVRYILKYTPKYNKNLNPSNNYKSLDQIKKILKINKNALKRIISEAGLEPKVLNAVAYFNIQDVVVQLEEVSNGR